MKTKQFRKEGVIWERFLKVRGNVIFHFSYFLLNSCEWTLRLIIGRQSICQKQPYSITITDKIASVSRFVRWMVV